MSLFKHIVSEFGLKVKKLFPASLNLTGEQSKNSIFEKPYILIFVKYCTIFERTYYIGLFDFIKYFG